MAARPRRQVAELEIENRLLRRQNRSDRIASILNSLIRWSGLAFIAWCCQLSVKWLAGTDTSASFLLDIAANVGIGKWLAYAIGAGGLVFGWRQRKLRKDTVQRLSSRTTELEKRIDKNRTSSRLTNRGETRPEERQ